MGHLWLVVVMFLSFPLRGWSFSASGHGGRIKSMIYMVSPKPSGYSSTKEGKAAVIARTKQMIDKSSMIITIPFEGVTKENTDILRKSLPDGVSASIVKNALMRKSVEGTTFEALLGNLKHQNMFFFIPEGQAKAGFDGFRKWQKEIKRIEPEYDAKVLVTEGQVYTGARLEYVVSLPSKQELITKIALGIKATPLRLARAIKAVPNKLGRAIGAVKTKLEESEVGVGVEKVVASS